jgi:predicted TPR repeat methyltransferase
MNHGDRENRLQQVYGGKSTAELKAVYDDWAEDYDDDLQSYGYRYPAVLAGLAGRYLDPRNGAVLDAGAGTGLMGEILSILGFSELVGIDMSDGMLEMARRKSVYSRLENMVLGEELGFADDTFSAVISTGVLTVGHAPASALDELVRVTRPGGHLIFSLTTPTYEHDGFREKFAALETAGRWQPVTATGEFMSLPTAPSEDVQHLARFYIFEAS